jgi:hypothetical protein
MYATIIIYLHSKQMRGVYSLKTVLFYGVSFEWSFIRYDLLYEMSCNYRTNYN